MRNGKFYGNSNQEQRNPEDVNPNGQRDVQEVRRVVVPDNDRAPKIGQLELWSFG